MFRSALTVTALCLSLAGCGGASGPSEVMGHTPDATLEMQQAQAALLAVGGGGKGTITYHGRTYPFSMVGIGVGGIGVSSFEASGEVYNLEELALFSGSYVQLRYGLGGDAVEITLGE